MQIFSKVDIGRVRSSNQDAADAFMLTPDVAFGIVCDGMGGAKGGDIASSNAVRVISDYVKNSYVPGMSNEKAAQLLKNAILSANDIIYNISLSESSLSGMGTTVVATIVTDGYAVVCHMGDSRAYIINNNIVQLTTDHSIVQSLIASGKLSLKEAQLYPDKNVITRALGVEPDVLSDFSVIPVKSDDCILLCTDGLTNFVEPSEILSVFRNNDLPDVANELINRANSGGGGDNISVVIVSRK